MNIKINGLTWGVICVPSNDKKLYYDKADCYGVTYFQEQEIYLDEELSVELFRQTVIHELVHAFLFSFGYHLECDMVEEAVCDFAGSHLDKIYKTANKIVSHFFKGDSKS